MFYVYGLQTMNVTREWRVLTYGTLYPDDLAKLRVVLLTMKCIAAPRSPARVPVASLVRRFVRGNSEEVIRELGHNTVENK